MTKFIEPEIKVIGFTTEDVITTSGYIRDITDDYVSDLYHNSVIGGEDGDIPL